MSGFDIEVNLPVPPAQAWQFIVDRGHEVEPLTFVPQGPQGPGTLNHLKIRVAGITITAVSRTISWLPPARCEFESVKPSWPVKVTITELFEPKGAGTRHSIRYRVAGSGPIGRLVAPLVAAFMKQNRRQYQRRLHSALSYGR